jgi:multidrug efflux pump subunit AcrA (membrane-fusion protein)
MLQTPTINLQRRNARIAGALSLLCALVLAACGGVAPAGQTGGQASGPTGGGQTAGQIPTSTPIPTAPAAARPTYTVQRGTVQQMLEFSGRWLPRDQQRLSFTIAGTVGAVNVRRGDTVNAGDLLAAFQITELESQLASAQLSLQTALAQLQSGADGGNSAITSAQFGLASAQIGLENTRLSAPWISLETARLGLEDAQVALENAQRNYDDAVSRAESSAAVEGAFTALNTARDGIYRAQLNYQGAAQSYAAYVLSLQTARNQVLQAEIALINAQSGVTNVDPARIQAVYTAQLQVNDVQAKIAQSSLYAPFSGVVLEVTIRPGDAAKAFDTVITLALPEPREVIAEIAFNDTQQLSVGMVGVCQELNLPETAVQCVIRQLPLSSRDADQTVRVAAGLDATQEGRVIEVLMPLDVRENVLWLPPAAVRTFQNRTFVILQTAQGQRVQDVTIGLRTDERVEIQAGVNEGDVVEAP